MSLDATAICRPITKDNTFAVSHDIACRLTLDSKKPQLFTLNCKDDDQRDISITFTVTLKKSSLSKEEKWHLATNQSKPLTAESKAAISRIKAKVTSLARNSQLLHSAVKDGNLLTVSRLIIEGCCVDTMDSEGKSALLIAVELDHYHIASELTKCPLSKETANQVFPLAAQKGWVLIIEGLSEKVDINTQDQMGFTALKRAIINDHSILAIKLLTMGANPNIVDAHKNERWPPLSNAVMSGNELLILKFIEVGTNINAQDGKGFTPLSRAIENEQHKFSLLLIELGANINLANEVGDTPLMIASRKNNYIVCQQLLSGDVNVDAINKKLDTALHIAARNNRADIVELLLEKKPKFLTNNYNETPLGTSIRSDSFACTFSLTQHAINMKSLDFFSLPCVNQLNLIEAAKRYRPAETLLFVKYCQQHWQQFISNERSFTSDRQIQRLSDSATGKHSLLKSIYRRNSIDEQNEVGLTLLCEAAKKNDVDKIEYLLNFGASVSATSGRNWSPIMYAANADSYRAIDLLIRNGANPNASDSDDYWTPLTCAASRNHAISTQYLLENEADTSLTNQEGYTPLMQAIKNRSSSTSLILIQHELKTDEQALGSNVVHSSNLKLTDNYKNNLLMLACHSGLETAVLALINTKMFSLDAMNKFRETALYIAASIRKKEGPAEFESIVLTLLEEGATLTESKTRNVLTVAIETGNIRIALLLIEHAYKNNLANIITQRDPQGDTPLNLSKKLSRTSVQHRLEQVINLLDNSVYEEYVDLTKEMADLKKEDGETNEDETNDLLPL
ncbi:hypothetical protein D5R81_12105 [Parashewanella spongiae]|uniref:Uncharacterized protein n=1 Tax=Parashewanella spongiae TaxID=342950 RepID=A0A3A6TPJ0_9GAMM|nr:ankyrin repeat domain-containing protein [Parashewanella spongiae]MCL1078681.1 ankyrin repeat domain-containing protein [Parashewanella spongiae]RJY12946.1 hypothetical protein D5R81_12105 [Parashewanella spongiae]